MTTETAETATRHEQEGTFTLTEALAYLKNRRVLPEDYNERHLRSSLLAWGFSAHVLSRTFRRIGEERYVLLDPRP